MCGRCCAARGNRHLVFCTCPLRVKPALSCSLPAISAPGTAQAHSRLREGLGARPWALYPLFSVDSVCSALFHASKWKCILQFQRAAEMPEGWQPFPARRARPRCRRSCCPGWRARQPGPSLKTPGLMHPRLGRPVTGDRRRALCPLHELHVAESPPGQRHFSEAPSPPRKARLSHAVSAQTPDYLPFNLCQFAKQKRYPSGLVFGFAYL